MEQSANAECRVVVTKVRWGARAPSIQKTTRTLLMRELAIATNLCVVARPTSGCCRLVMGCGRETGSETLHLALPLDLVT